MLLQEVNPLPEKAEAFVAALKTFGSQYTEVHRADASGIRVFGLRVVPGLNNGMADLVKAPLRLRKVAGLKLSGGIGGCGDFFGLQFGELRYALIAEIENPTSGNKFLAVSLHLHSGIERMAYFIQRVTEAEEHGRIRRGVLQDFVSALEQDQKRRPGEIRVLVAELRRLLAEERDLGVILGGNFNFEPDSPEYRELLAAGLRDTHMIASPSNDLYSYDAEQNGVVRQKELTIPPSLSQAMANLPEAEQHRIVENYRQSMRASETDRLSVPYEQAAKTKRVSRAGTVRRTDSSLSSIGIRSLRRAEYLHLRSITVLTGESLPPCRRAVCAPSTGVRVNVARTGVVNILKGAKPGRTSALRVDMDALPVKEPEGLSFAPKQKVGAGGRRSMSCMPAGTYPYSCADGDRGCAQRSEATCQAWFSSSFNRPKRVGVCLSLPHGRALSQIAAPTPPTGSPPT